MLAYSGVLFQLLWLVLLGLSLWGLIHWYMSTTDTTSKVFAVILMLMVIGISFSVILPDD